MFKKNFEPKFDKATGVVTGYRVAYFDCVHVSNPIFPMLGRLTYEADKTTGKILPESVKLYRYGVEGDIPYVTPVGAPEPLGPKSKFLTHLQSEHDKIHTRGRDRFM